MKLLSEAFFSKNRARIAIQKRHLEGRSTKTEGSRAKKRLSVAFFSKNRARIAIQKSHIEGRITKIVGSRTTKGLSVAFFSKDPSEIKKKVQKSLHLTTPNFHGIYRKTSKKSK